MKKDTQPRKGVSKSNVTASATATTGTQQASPQRLDAAGSGAVSVTTPPMSARYIDSRLKQFCLR